MYKIQKVTVSIFAVATLWFFSTQARSQSPVAPAELMNRSYMSSCGREKPASLRLKDGKFGRYLLLADEERKMELIVMGTTEVEIAGDRRRHYAVFAKCDFYGKGGYELFIFRRSGRRLDQISNAVSAKSGGLYELKYIKQENGLILVGLAYLLPRVKLPPKGSRYEFRFRLVGSKLETAGSGILDK